VNQTQAPAAKYVQTNGYGPTSSLTGGESGQARAGSVSSAPPPPVYTGPWQYPQIDHTSPETGYQTTPSHHGPVYGGSTVEYHEDAPQLPHMGSSMLGPGNYLGYQPHLSDQHADAFLQLSGWDDSNTAALWPNTIMIMPHPQHPQHQQHQQHQQQSQQPQQPQQQQQQQQQQ